MCFLHSGETKDDSIPSDPGTYSVKTDVRDFGEIMCEVITGDLPKRDSKHCFIVPVPNLPKDYEQIVKKYLDSDPKKQPSSRDLVSFFRKRMDRYS
jgi:hypothetical protein